MADNYEHDDETFMLITFLFLILYFIIKYASYTQLGLL